MRTAGIAKPHNTSRDANRDGIIGKRFVDDGACADDTMTPDVRHNHGSITNPGVPSDSDPRPLTGLLPDWNVESFDAVLRGSVHDRDVRTDKHIVLERDSSETPKTADIHVAAYFRRWVREDGAKAQAGVRAKARENEPVERAA
jgi:hypothetical protein